MLPQQLRVGRRKLIDTTSKRLHQRRCLAQTSHVIEHAAHSCGRGGCVKVSGWTLVLGSQGCHCCVQLTQVVIISITAEALISIISSGKHQLSSNTTHALLISASAYAHCHWHACDFMSNDGDLSILVIRALLHGGMEQSSTVVQQQCRKNSASRRVFRCWLL